MTCTKSVWEEYFDATAHQYMVEEYAQPWKQEVDFYNEYMITIVACKVAEAEQG